MCPRMVDLSNSVSYTVSDTQKLAECSRHRVFARTQVLSANLQQGLPSCPANSLFAAAWTVPIGILASDVLIINSLPLIKWV